MRNSPRPTNIAVDRMRYLCIIAVASLTASFCDCQKDCRVVASCTKGNRNYPAMRRLPVAPVAPTSNSTPVDLPAMKFQKDPTASQNCKSPGWIIGVNGYQYQMMLSLGTWQDARNICRSVGGTLPRRAFDNDDSAEFLEAIMRIYGDKSGFWLPVSDRATESKWVWDDGTPLTTNKYWAQNQPDGSGNCGWVSRDWGYKWDDGVCDSTFAALCEREIDPSSVVRA